VVALGCIIEGETTHFEVLSNAIFDKLIQISIDHDTPITSAILTVKNEQQAIERSDGGSKDRAIEAAKSLVSLIKLKRDL
jgi:6,7-dimethyl-8-ribityllumazine synthase